jgi:FtsX extracellular domain
MDPPPAVGPEISTPPPRAGSRRRLLIWVSAIIALLLAFGAGVLTAMLLTDPERVIITGQPPFAGSTPKPNKQTITDADIVIDLFSENGQISLCEVLPGRLTTSVQFSGDDPNALMNEAERVARTDSTIEVVGTETRQQAFERFQEVFADRPELLRQVRAEALPATLTLAVRDDIPISDVQAKAADLPEAETPDEDAPPVTCELSEVGKRVLSEATENGQAEVP